LRDNEAAFREQGVNIVVVTFDNSVSARSYIAETGLQWTVLIDEQRTLYKAYGMQQGSFLDIWGPASWLAYLQEFSRGQRLQKPGSDIMQRGGDVLIDPEGIVQLHHIGKGPADRPTIEQLLSVVNNMVSDKHR
jgi:hypothetical protein